MPATRVVVNIPGEDAYNVRIGAGVLDTLGSSLRGVPAVADARQALVITDANVGQLYLARAKASLVQAGYRVSDICVCHIISETDHINFRCKEHCCQKSRYPCR